jgi:hypothetical protein
MARLYANENFPFPVVEELRRLGHDILTTLEAGKANQAIPDEEVVAYASSEDRAVLTLNRKHFIRLHHQDNNHWLYFKETNRHPHSSLEELLAQAVSFVPIVDQQTSAS